MSKITREQFEAKARTGFGVGQCLDQGYLVIVSCGDGCQYENCAGWRLDRVDHPDGLHRAEQA